MNLSRRTFLGRLAASAGGPFVGRAAAAATGSAGLQTLDEFPLSHLGDPLRGVYRDLRRHFVFEYYPWYATEPFRHWQQWGRQPPTDLAATSVPRLGAYDSRDLAVIEQHARWIAEAGVGVVDLSWWRPQSYSDQAVHRVMDVMNDHDIQVMFHLEPYGPERADLLAADIRYLVSEYGERRHWDCFFLHQRADGSQGPVFKMFATLVPDRIVDCHGRTLDVPLHVPSSRWRRSLDVVRAELRGVFDHVTLLSDAADAEGVHGAGFDGISVYDPTLEPETWLGHALAASRLGLVYSFNSNPGMDVIERRKVLPDSCYRRPSFVPSTLPIDWNRPEDLARVVDLSTRRIAETLRWSILLQTHPSLGNLDAGFFLVFLTSFNEWHEGTQFEPMKDRAALTAAERAVGYHNPDDGAYRLRVITELLRRFRESAGVVP